MHWIILFVLGLVAATIYGLVKSGDAFTLSRLIVAASGLWRWLCIAAGVAFGIFGHPDPTQFWQGAGIVILLAFVLPWIMLSMCQWVFAKHLDPEPFENAHKLAGSIWLVGLLLASVWYLRVSDRYKKELAQEKAAASSAPFYIAPVLAQSPAALDPPQPAPVAAPTMESGTGLLREQVDQPPAAPATQEPPPEMSRYEWRARMGLDPNVLATGSTAVTDPPATDTLSANQAAGAHMPDARQPSTATSAGH